MSTLAYYPPYWTPAERSQSETLRDWIEHEGANLRRLRNQATYAPRRHEPIFLSAGTTGRDIVRYCWPHEPRRSGHDVLMVAKNKIQLRESSGQQDVVCLQWNRERVFFYLAPGDLPVVSHEIYRTLRVDGQSREEAQAMAFLLH